MKYKITIATPCHQKWSEMTTIEKGKFCNSCSKEVIDFTKLSTKAISEKVLSKPNLCGRFKNTQLNKEIESNTNNNLLKVAASFAIISTITVSEPFFSQLKQDTIQKVYSKKGKLFVKKDSIDKTITIKGTVKDVSGGLPGVSIVLKDSTSGTQSDFDGNFLLKIPNKKINSYILVFSYLGYVNQEINILYIKKPLIVELKENENILGGISITTGMVVVAKKPNIFKRLSNLFRKKEE